MATRNELNDWENDEDISARKLTSMSRGIRAVTPLTAGKGIRVHTSPNGGTSISTVGQGQRTGFWVELTAEGTGGDAGWYSWKEIIPKPTNPVNWADADPPVIGTLTAHEINDRAGLADTEPARFFIEHAGLDSDGNAVYLFSAGALPTGQIQHQHYQTVTQLGAGWNQALAVPDITEVDT